MAWPQCHNSKFTAKCGKADAKIRLPVPPSCFVVLERGALFTSFIYSSTTFWINGSELTLVITFCWLPWSTIVATTGAGTCSTTCNDLLVSSFRPMLTRVTVTETETEMRPWPPRSDWSSERRYLVHFSEQFNRGARRQCYVTFTISWV